MELLQSTNFTVDKNRTQKYFGKYEYRISAKIKGIHYFRKAANECDFNAILTRKNGHIRATRWYVADEVKQTKDDILRLICFRVQLVDKSKYTFRISHDCIILYSDDFSILSEFYNLFTNNVKFELIKIGDVSNYDRGIIYHINPKNKLRIYFKWKYWSQDEKRSLAQYVKSNSNEIFPSPTFKNWMHKELENRRAVRYFLHSGYTQDTMFWDTNDEKHAIYLNLVYGDVVRKLCQIEKR